jgi:hypothetical protein
LSSQKLLAKNNWFNKYYKRLPVYLPENFKSFSFFFFNAIKEKKNLINFKNLFLSQFFSFFWVNFFFILLKSFFVKKELIFNKYFYFYSFFNFFRSSTVYYNFFKFFSLSLNSRLLSFNKQSKKLNLFFRKFKTLKNKRLNLAIKILIAKFNLLFFKVLNEILLFIKLFANLKKKRI